MHNKKHSKFSASSMMAFFMSVFFFFFCHQAYAKKPFEQVYTGYNGPETDMTTYFQDAESLRASWITTALKPQDVDLILGKVDFQSQVVVVSAVGARKAVTSVKLGDVRRMGESLSALVLVGVAHTDCPGPRPESYPFVIGIVERPEHFDNLPNYFHQNFPDACHPVMSEKATELTKKKKKMGKLLFSISVIILCLIPILGACTFFKSATFKGWFGEKRVSRKARRHLPHDIYFPYDNVTIADEHGTTQIDHIYVSQFGVFVVETKNMTGWIFGKYDQAKWTQTTRRSKHIFQNPIHQNYKHLKMLETMLQIPSSKMHTVIVFTGNTVFKTDMPKCVCTLSNFTHYIKSFDMPLLTKEEVFEVRSKIESGRLKKSLFTHARHVSYLRDKHL